MRERAQGVKEGYVFSMGEHRLVGFRVPFEELAQRPLTLLDHLVVIIYASHLQRSPPSLYVLLSQRTPSLPVAAALKLPALLTRLPRRLILGNPERPTHSYHCTRVSPSYADCTVAGTGAGLPQTCQSRTTNPV